MSQSRRFGGAGFCFAILEGHARAWRCLSIAAAPSGFQLPARALCAPSLLTVAVGCSGVRDLPDPVAGFAMERGCSWQGADGGDLWQHLRPLQEPKLPEWDGVEWGCFPAAWAVFPPPPSWQLQS